MASVYPKDVFPSLWMEMETSLFSPEIYFHVEVHNEMKKWAHPTLNWYLNHLQPSQILHPDEEEVDAYKEVTDWAVNKRVPGYSQAATDEFVDIADAWLVASAYRHDATVVPNEVPAPQGTRKVKIPDAAAAFNVPCINTLEFLRELKVSV